MNARPPISAEQRVARVENLAVALDEIRKHAAAMESAEELRHEPSCLWCSTAVLLARVVAFGRQEREAMLQEVPRG